MRPFRTLLTNEDLPLLGRQLLTQADAVQRTLDQALGRTVTVRDMLSGAGFALPLDWAGIDALRNRARRALDAEPEATFAYQSQAWSLRDAATQFETVAAAADEWRDKH